jgi:hypothetical protein
MSNSISAREPVFRFPKWRTAEPNTIDQGRYDALAAELQASLAREDALREGVISCSEKRCWFRNSSTG